MGERITISTPDGGFSAYVARPEAETAPAVVVIQEIFGVNQVMRDITDGLAAQGYLAICPDLFWRIEPDIDITDKSKVEWDKAFALFNAFDVDLGVKDIQATITRIRADAQSNDKVGCVGFCLGGRLAFLAATRTDVDAAVGYYGVGIEGVVGEAEKLTRPLMLHIAEEDGFVPPTAQAIIKQALKDHPNVEIHSYPGRDHAFARAGGEHYHEGDARLAGGRTLQFFERTIG
ncbi:MAG: dienelactone hydrolase family protein [Phenylobacterium sp.]|uniref:dienelactone hydrolase family protein n=1 Tax=Phenylobacterium sp. TaxID=1871053 RepID=UPI001A60DBEC|nr:dienelactone hydrolase family protein [Phenylobacterium sp.]MBL8553009.1 dienelactone hydrolase family protein [Phenylobacterium sp.]